MVAFTRNHIYWRLLFDLILICMTYEDILLALVLNGSNDSGSNHGLLPGLCDIEDVETVLVTLKNVSFHLLSHVLGSDVDLCQTRKRNRVKTLVSA